MSDPLNDLSHALGGPVGTGIIRANPEDFQVDEEIGFELTGEGEHVFVQVEKRGENTDFIARRLARFAEIPARNVGYAGLKDRHALTTQWFSVQLPGRDDPDWPHFNASTYRILRSVRHSRKLKRGALAGNRFRLVVRESTGDRQALEQRLDAIAADGVPNYFGTQRFGRDGGNLSRALDLLAGRSKEKDRHKRSLYLSAARSYLFNALLSERVGAGTWNQAIPGDVFMFDRSHTFFRSDAPDPEILARVDALQIHPTGPLWGTGPGPVAGEARVLEEAVARRHGELAAGLERFGLEMDRRALRLRVDEFEWYFGAEGELELSFSLAAGAYATAVLRELLILQS